ncbi:MAG: DUF2190 family protein [Alphaproteobacteria bacterium]|nr:DUF2190 family protein [Alphaproteobacteria bacterium]MDD9919773.1 DUF2190 family protein [Alphaproteobacteria bacterium]
MQNISLLKLSVQASGAVTAKQFVGFDGAVATAAGNAYGVAEFDAANTELVSLTIVGTAVVKSGAAFAKGAALEVGSDGKAVTQSAGVTVARALEAASAADEDVEVLLINN